MNTKHYVVDPDKPDFRILAETAAVLRQGGLVAFPTETVYGLGANGLDPRAVTRIFAAKGRPADNPLILHIAERHEVNKLASRVPANAAALMAKYWPGPLTVVLDRTRLVPDEATGGLDTVAIRLPDSTVARELIRLAGVPVAAPSANTSGRPSPTTAQDVLADLAGRIEVVIDAGPCGIGVESTVVDCTTPVPTLLRPGGVTLEMLMETLGEVEIDPALGGENFVPRAPGMKYTHYAPAAPMTLYEGEAAAVAPVLAEEAAKLAAAGRRTGAVVTEETARLLPPETVAVVYGAQGDLEAAAANLYSALRHFDAAPVDAILAEGVAETGLGLAVMNRMRKAAGYRIIRCE
ncbi:MAG TPA: L-threonylcarbamoyladenylate synthase [Negativicutes bacterium]|nr:L-threonylcarbamoyladenylate synthase [Negativicutes bacterium]